MANLRNAISRFIEECKNMKELKKIHSQIITSPFLLQSDKFLLLSRLLFLCAISDLGSLGYATVVFRFMKNPNLFVYNVMIRAYASKINGGGNEICSSQSLLLYKQMLSEGIAPNCLTFPFLVKECTTRLHGRTGRSIHAQVIRYGFYNDVFVQNSLIVLYSAYGTLRSARKLFDEMTATRDLVSWNSMIIGHLRSGELDEALGLFRKMSTKNIVTWNSIITGFVQGGRPREALAFFRELQLVSSDMVRPDKITIASVLSACASLGAIDHGKWVHSYLKMSGQESDMVIGTALIDMYGKCGCVEKAYEVFKEMQKKDTLAWTAMISVFALHGFSKEALNLYEEMKKEGVRPNHVTFVGLLSACAHSGLVAEGRCCFVAMKQVHLIEPEVYHYACMVDILSRAALFEEAEELIRSMPMKPDAFVWGALLGGCQMHANVELGERVAQYLVDLEPLNHAFYVNLCDIYAKSGRFEDVKRIRTLMKERGIKKEVPGCSMIEIDGVVHEFSVRGSPDVQMDKIIGVLKDLNDDMKMGRVSIILM
ncbi:pentatricopeptide repeat-containing protein At5g66520-like isoform X1 [Ziziphus jujuba]|uniref:Pentatricopeptide repeat-containing protein At5g66520-like isoform X1 n=1 Tax=Ziziphus jujuba TaxID=326968 RepID=A0A6P6G0C1_ZIZJJ|nr:pentatricopeptide repeat-containing protein At5g66520-like isoform X1 [Ziziphus jujuba]